MFWRVPLHIQAGQFCEPRLLFSNSIRIHMQNLVVEAVVVDWFHISWIPSTGQFWEICSRLGQKDQVKKRIWWWSCGQPSAMLHMWYLWYGRLYVGGIGGIPCKTLLLNIRCKWFRIGEMKRLFITWMDLVEMSGVVVIEQFHSLSTFFS